MNIEIQSVTEHRVFPKPSHVSDQGNEFQAVLPGASSFGSCSCGALSTDLLDEE